ncbi:RNA 2',3'-cyclic phosphodiesterase [Candidatus Woesearchaeota archaeon]|nr:RNA 2',3'-cyclic phosphodiesterase [Candidatus Woesearchaeota archaeon]
MRLFLGIWLSAGARDHLAALISSIRPALHADDRLAFVRQENLHLTLLFLGEVRDSMAGRIQKVLSGLDAIGFSLALTGIGAFPSPAKPRVIWAGISPEEPVRALYQRICAVLAPSGFSGEKGYHPHITLARVKRLGPASSLPLRLNRTKVMPLPLDVSSFSLIRSELTPQGPLYSTISSFPLRKVL